MDNLLLFSAEEVLDNGLSFLGLPWQRMNESQKEKYFHGNYGSSAEDIAELFGEMFLHVDPTELDERGLKEFMMSIHYLWVYPKNSYVLSTMFQHYAERKCRGEYIWKWIKRIGALKDEKIDINNALDADVRFCLSYDGVEFGAWEDQHPQFNQDPKAYSRKNGRCGYKYMFALSLHDDKLCMIDGPHQGTVSELTSFRDELKPLLPPGTMVVVDAVMKNEANPEEHAMLAFPNEGDGKELKKFKTRARQRQEAFHARLRKFAILRDDFRHGGMEKHKLVVEAVCVIVQICLDNGGMLFDP